MVIVVTSVLWLVGILGMDWSDEAPICISNIIPMAPYLSFSERFVFFIFP